MKKAYLEPEVVVRKYSFCADSVTTSDMGDSDLNRDDEVDFFA